MLVPHLLLAHMLADYTLQTNWLIVRKGQSWDGLALHGFMVFLMAVMVLPGYLSVLLGPLVVLALVHTFQDWVKIYTGPRIKIHPFIPYMIDQFLHITAILILQGLVGHLMQPPPSQVEQLVMATGAVSISVTRFYDVTWWANWLEMIPFMNRWQVWGYAERLAMVALTAIGLFFLAPLCIVPRLWYAQRYDTAIWLQPHGKLEIPIGILFSIGLGLVLRAMLLAL
ncbi:MAG: DUF3307 domain-containing protein [Chloroflexota bacterium]